MSGGRLPSPPVMIGNPVKTAGVDTSQVTKRRREPMTGITVDQLWRYPVKSLRGEQLESAVLTKDGVAGDRVVHVAGPKGPLTGRTRHGLLSLQATTGADGDPAVDGHPWRSPEAAALVVARAGADARLVADQSTDRFDVLNLLVATDAAVAAWGHDVRRLRPNLVLAGLTGSDERDLEGWVLAIGSVRIGLHSVRGRCIVTSIDPESGEQDLDVFRRIRTDFGGVLALNSWVIAGGEVHVGDPVEFLRLDAEPEHIGGWIVGAPYPHADSARAR